MPSMGGLYASHSRDQRQSSISTNVPTNTLARHPILDTSSVNSDPRKQSPASPYATNSIDLQSILGKSYSPKGGKSPHKPLASPEAAQRKPSASNSGNSVKDGLGNLNRWSQSTESSKESFAHRRSTSFPRRISFGGHNIFKSSSSTEPKQSEPSKSFTKVASISSSRSKEPAPHPTTHNPPPNIAPPILNTNHDAQASMTQPAVIPSTAGLISAAARNVVPDYFGRVWDAPLAEGEEGQAGDLEPHALDEVSENQDGNNNSISIRATQSRQTVDSHGHSRHRSTAGKSSAGTLASNLSESSRGTARGTKPPSQKAMLSKALQKANTAVLLDNAQNFEGAMQAYTEACGLLQQVMYRSSGTEDKRKLEAIRNTYSSRIQELEKITPQLSDGKQLPERPGSKPDSTVSSQPTSPRSTDMRGSAIIETATVARIVNDISYTPSQGPRQPLPQLPERRSLSQSYSKRSMSDGLLQANTFNAMNSDYMPQPLSPGRPPNDFTKLTTPYSLGDITNNKLRTKSAAPSHSRNPSTESTSWLDTINESGSASSSVHSRTSSLRVRRKHIRAPSGATEAEFDAALDAAVEAAYDDGPEMADTQHPPIIDDYDNEVVLNARRRVEMAKEMVRQTELESEREMVIQMARDQERARILKQDRERMLMTQPPDDDEDDSEDEERMLEEMTRGYVMDEFEFDLQNKSALPRESDSSRLSSRTWDSNLGSLPDTGISERSSSTDRLQLDQDIQAQPRHAPPLSALPALPGTALSGVPSNTKPSVRSRRLSGHNIAQLSIETYSRPTTQPPSTLLPQQPSRPSIPVTGSTMPQSSSVQEPLTPGLSPGSKPGMAVMDTVYHTRPSSPRDLPGGFDSKSQSESVSNDVAPQQQSFKRQPSATYGGRPRNLSISIPEDSLPGTPSSNSFGFSPELREPDRRLPTTSSLPTPMATAYREKVDAASAGSMFFLSDDLGPPESGNNTSSMPNIPGGPIPLEPCPRSFLLRPFWLMRALYQTIAHPRGGYLSTKLFIPRDVWRVKGVKLKGIEDKIAVIDYLVAALQRIARVDTNDADLVLDEMQALESILEHAQTALSKKLGTDVGIQASTTMFKDAEYIPGMVNEPNSGSKTPSATRSTFSWKRLRTKTSSSGLATSYHAKGASTSTNLGMDGKDMTGMASLPMTSMNTIRFARRDLSAVNFSGPNATYMASLARLFDIVQVVDQIARQVEDPGLRHADKTQVGLELSTRHAAEFFGFYICRFVLADIGLLLDKFIKRGSEWVVV